MLAASRGGTVQDGTGWGWQLDGSREKRAGYAQQAYFIGVGDAGFVLVAMAFMMLGVSIEGWRLEVEFVGVHPTAYKGSGARVGG
jgi:hypothetical protein